MSGFSNNDEYQGGGSPGAPGAPDAGEQPAMMPLMTGGGDAAQGGWAGGDDTDGGAWGGATGSGDGADKSMLGQGSILIDAIVLIAAGSLYAMRLSGGGLATNPATEQAEAKIEKYLAKASVASAMDADDPMAPGSIDEGIVDTEIILEVFNATVVDRQVPVEFIAKNPFALRLTNNDSAATPVVDRDAAMRLKKLEAQLAKLELQTVMGGARLPVAVISNEFYRKGDAVGDFTLATISPETQSVTLTAEGHQFELTMMD